MLAEHLVKLFADAALLLSLGTALLFFLGFRKETTYLRSLQYDTPRILPSYNVVLIAGFKVVIDFATYDDKGYSRYFARGLLLGAATAFLFPRAPASETSGDRGAIWTLGIFACWAFSLAAQHQGRSEGEKQRDKRPPATIFLNKEGEIQGNNLYVAKNFYVIRATKGEEPTRVVLVPFEGVERIEIGRNPPSHKSDTAKRWIGRWALKLVLLSTGLVIGLPACHWITSKLSFFYVSKLPSLYIWILRE